MITVDISNVWGQLELGELLAMEQEAAAAHALLMERGGPEKESLGWLDLPVREETPELRRIREAAQQIRRDSQVCVVVGIGGSCLGPKAAMELLQGQNRNLDREKGNPQIFFAGNSLSTRQWKQLLRLLDDRDFSVIAISKSGTTLEPAIAFRALRWMLERKYGTDKASKRIYAVTDPSRSTLGQMAAEAGWETFAIPDGVGERFSVLSPAGLLPMAVAGIDILEVLKGAAEGKAEYSEASFENPVWQYAAVRNLLYRRGKVIEILASWEPDFQTFGSWWQQLFGESEGKDGKGIFPVTAQMPGDLHVLGQRIQQGQRNLFETMVRFDPPRQKLTIGGDWKNLDELNFLEGKTLDFVEEGAFLGAAAVHSDGGVGVITMDCGELNEGKVGELFFFLELCCAVSACILGVDPFDQPGVALYQQNLFRLLGKPGYEP